MKKDSAFNGFENEISILKNWIETSDAIVIGAGAGLSTSAGFDYSGKRFDENFADFKQKYGFDDMYSGGFYPYKTLEEFWAYWSRYVLINRYEKAPKPTYEKLLSLVKDKNYFAITTNIDHCFQKAGFDKERLFYTQGDYGLFQCSTPCHKKTYDNENAIRKMVAIQKNMRIPSELIPRCPVCGQPMTMNLRSDNKFVEDDGWANAYCNYENFINKHKNGKILYFELGVGSNTPAIIKYPFWRLTAVNNNARYACINLCESYCPKEIENQSVCINFDIHEIIERLLT